MINLDFDAASFPAYDLLNYIYIYIWHLGFGNDTEFI